MSAREKVLEQLVIRPIQGHGGGMTISHLVDATGYSASQVGRALRALERDKQATGILLRGERERIWFK